MSVDKLKLVVFDLDYTLWPFHVEMDVTLPFRKTSSGTILDAGGVKIKCFPEAPEVLKSLHEQGYTIAAASRTTEINGAHQLIELFGWSKYFTYKEIFPGSKITHFNNLKRDSGLDFKQMLFFDDDYRNIHDVSEMGVICIFVRNGASKKVVKDGLAKFENDRK